MPATQVGGGSIMLLKTGWWREVTIVVLVIGFLPGVCTEGPCPDNCDNCTQSLCTVCEVGYYGESCERECQKDNETCSSCKTIFYRALCENNCSTGCNTSATVSYETCVACLSPCNDSLYGDDCRQSCSDTCKNSQCRQYDGACTEGCLDGWKGSQCTIQCPPNCQTCNDTFCTQCKSGWFDLSGECDKKCSTFCLHGGCDSHGKCEHGCVEGFFGPKCNQTCLDDNCLQCKRDTGQCLECKPTWYGSTCDQPCPNCTEGNCSRSGECLEGCQAGLHGNNCTIPCNDFCNTRQNGTSYVHCEQQTGKCLDGCTDGRYGEKCDQNCSDTCNASICNQTTGKCTYGCQSGRYGDLCDQNCSVGCIKESNSQCFQSNGSCVAGCQRKWYGDHCNKICPRGCNGSLCDRNTGLCVEGCNRGVMGDNCSVVCSKYQYGYNCNEKCDGHHCINNATCDPSFGNCSAGCADGYGGALCDQLMESGQQGSGVSLPIVISVVAILIIAVVVVFGLFIYKRRHKVNNNVAIYLTVRRSGSIDYRSSDEALTRGRQNEHTHSSHIYEEIADGDTYYNIASGHLTVKVSSLKNYIRHMKSEAGFIQQFKELPSGLLHTCNVAMHNQVKNRYNNIYAYDKSRVVLYRDQTDDDSLCDYINANYISMKCAMYWPELDSRPTVYGNVVVGCTIEEVFAHYTVRTLKICNIKKGRPWSTSGRVVKHFQFTSWPVCEGLIDLASLVEFYFKVMRTPTHGQGPMVVHCSTGVGRTGVFLAIANLTDEAKRTGMVNPFICVHKMRHERVDMVQTAEQYEIVHLALAEAMKARDSTILVGNFQTCFEDLIHTNPQTGVSKIREQFEALVIPSIKPEEYQTAMMPNNIAKNRFKDILASDHCRPHLTTPIHGRTDYINAVFLPGHKQKRAFILTQMPMQDTVTDFWMMMFESNSKTIVMLNDKHDDQMSMGYYWPRTVNGREMYGFYFVEAEGCEEYEGYRIITLNVTNNCYSSDPESHSCKESQRTIKLFQCHFWPQEQITPNSSIPMLQLLNAVDVWQQKTDQVPITVHCLDGVERSGLFCVLSAILERLKIEQDVSILQTINQMRACRPQLIQSFDQFKFLHIAVHEYLQRFSAYSSLA